MSSFARSTPEQVLTLGKKILKERGFDLSVYSPSYVQRRVDARLMRMNCSLEEYVRILDSDPNEYGEFFDVFTINVTEFFRDPSMWKVFGETVLPQVMADKIAQSSITNPFSAAIGKMDRQAAKPPNRPLPLQIWSSGCASGEEPYSIAIMLKEAIERIGAGNRDMPASIYATDIDQDSLEKARQGIYGKNSLKNVSPELMKKYFTVSPPSHPSRGGANDEWFKISDEIRKMVTFKKHHFLNDQAFKNMDVVFCRNAAIYLTPDTKDRLLEIFYNSLTGHGIFISGKAETILSKGRYFFSPVNINEHIYKKGDKTWQRS